MNVHRPSELLSNAERLYSTTDPDFMRAAVLEAITCLETYVHDTVFHGLESKLDPLLVAWLKDKTQMDFDSRLAVLTPVATGVPIDKTSDLWRTYKEARSIRHAVTHKGRRVSAEEARFVIDTVHEWLNYLVSTVEIELLLRDLKHRVEEGKMQVTSQDEGLRLLRDCFADHFNLHFERHHTPEGTFFNSPLPPLLELHFGKYRVIVGCLYASANRYLQELEEPEGSPKIEGSYSVPDAFTHGITVFFNRGRRVPPELAFQTVEGGRVVRTYINLPGRNS